MKNRIELADYNHPLVKETALRITQNADSSRLKLEKIFYYVRDEIKFGFLPEIDHITASEIIRRKVGQCNNKGILFYALCKACGIDVKIHFSLIKKEIQKGLFKGLGYYLIPKYLSHAWVEVYIDQKWRNIDSYINDQEYYKAAKQELKHRNWDTGFSVACSSGDSSIDFNLEYERFVQMDAVVEDQGRWDNPTDYYYSDNHKNRDTILKTLYIKYFIFPIVNRRVNRLRNGLPKKLFKLSFLFLKKFLCLR